MVDYRAIRRRARYSQARTAVESGTSEPTVRLFEAGGPDAIKNDEKREALVAYYDKLARHVASEAAA
jgi:hypothetical protein